MLLMKGWWGPDTAAINMWMSIWSNITVGDTC